MPDGSPWTQFFRESDGYRLRFPGMADFGVTMDGCQIEVWPTPGIHPATVQHLYLNQVLPLALSRRGILMFHASAVDLAGTAIAFVGSSGRGKSTLAASFAATGERFLTDDGLQIEWREQQLTVLPSHPSIRLWEDSQLALICESDVLAPPLGYSSKVRVLAGSSFAFCDEARALQSIYFLGEGDASSVTIRPMKSRAALMELVRHSFLLDVDEKEVLARHFEELTAIANLPIHYQLDYPRRYSELPTVRQTIIRHCTGRA